MSNFLVVIPATGQSVRAKHLFLTSLAAAREIRSQNPIHVVEADWAFAASFPRQNGSGGSLVSEPRLGSWLLAIGTWFHRDGYASGAESRLLDRYLETDASTLAGELEGFYVIAVGDPRAREVQLITDIVGSCHCFRRTMDEGTILSGSSLLLASIRDGSLDSIACQEFLNTGVIYEDRTCYQEVRKIGPGRIARFAATGETTHQYWKPSDAENHVSTAEATVEALWDSLTHAAKRVHSLFANPVCDLTGGYDSRAVVAAFVGANVNCATTVSGPDMSADVAISSALAKDLGLPHSHIDSTEPITPDELCACLQLTDGECDLRQYALIRRVHLRLAKEFDASINGSFGEVARGYWWELLLPRIGARRKLDARRLAAGRYAAHKFDASIFRSEHRLDLVSHFAGVVERTNSGLSDSPNTFQMDQAYLLMRMQRWQGRIASSTNQIWPCLSPFMFRSVLEVMLEARPILRWRGLLIRKMLAQFSSRIAKYPLEHGFPAEPASWRNLHRFVPLAAYFGNKVASKIGLRSHKKNDLTDRSSSQRLHLWDNEQIKNLMSLERMRAGSLLDSAGLSRFLENSRNENFEFDEQWARLLSLECALNVAAGVRKA